MQQPFGAETLVAFASAEPFPSDNGQDIGAGMVQLRGTTRDIVAHYRGVGINADGGAKGGKRAEKQVSLTTVKR